MIAAIITIIGLIGVIFGIVFPLYTRNKDKIREKEKAETEGKTHPIPIALFNDHKLILGNTYNIIMGVPNDNYKEDTKDFLILFSVIPIGVGNEGGSDLEDVNIIFKHAPHSPLPLSNERVEVIKKDFITKLERSYYKDHERQCSALKIGHISPLSMCAAEELVRIYPTNWIVDVPGTTKDNVDIVMKVKAQVVFLFDVILQIKNFPPQTFSFKLRAFTAKDFTELENEVITFLFKKEKGEMEASSKLDGKYLVYYPDYTPIAQPGYNKYRFSVGSFNIVKSKVFEKKGDYLIQHVSNRTKNAIDL